MATLQGKIGPKQGQSPDGESFGVFQVPKGIARLSLHSSSAAWSAHGFSLRLLPLHMCGIPRQADVPWSWPLQCSGVPTVTRLPLHGFFDFLQEFCSYITQHGLSRSLDLWCKTLWFSILRLSCCKNQYHMDNAANFWWHLRMDHSRIAFMCWSWGNTLVCCFEQGTSSRTLLV